MEERLRKQIKTKVRKCVEVYMRSSGIATAWRKPLIGFADAVSPQIRELRETVIASHELPENIIRKPTVIIVYFIPFAREVAVSNAERRDGRASEVWVRAYRETNDMMNALNSHLVEWVRSIGYEADFVHDAGHFPSEVLKSRWSHRHIARIAGLGTFGINNMLITEAGCCGRFQSVVTSLPITPDPPLEEEYCLYKSRGICGKCVENCPSGALTLEGFDRFACYETCLINEREMGETVCGKCDVDIPCAFARPGVSVEP